jgi:hypothetical protein
MPTTLTFRRGTTAQNNSFTGAAGEISVDTDKGTLRVHDNATAGGSEIVAVAATQTLTNKTFDANGTGNSISNIEVADFASGVVDTDLSSVSASDDTLASAKAIKAYVDTGLSSLSSTTLTEGNSTLTIADSGTGTLTLTLDGVTHTTFDSSGITLATGNFVGTATSAQYADLAEIYKTDEQYDIGTVVCVGGDYEVTKGSIGQRAIGAISEKPAYLMNSEGEGQAVALKGKVPVRVQGNISKGDELVAGNNGTAMKATDELKHKVFAIALENNQSESITTIQAIIL